MKKIVSFVFLSMLFLMAKGQSFDFSNSKFSQTLSLKTILSTSTPDTIKVEHDKWNYMWNNPTLWNANMKFKSLHDIVKFYIDYGNNKVVTNSYTYFLTYQLRGFNDANNPNTAVTFSDTLTIGYNKDSLKAYQDKFFKKYSGFHKIEVIISQVYKLDGSNPPILLTTANADGFNCRVEGEIWVQYYNKNYYGTTMLPLTVSKDITNIPTKRELNVSWKCASCAEPIKPAMYELEWTYIDNYKYNMVTHTADSIPIASQSYTFKNNATRVITKDTLYKIPMVYEKGDIVYRVRMLRPDSTDYIKPIYGQWSIAESGSLSSLSSANYYHNSQAFMSDSLNWQYNISFAEDAKFKHVVSYYDGLLHNKQATTKINSDSNYIIVAKTIDDYEGRPSIQLLPIPVQEKKMDYVKDFAINSNTNLYYRASDFDSIQAGQICTPPPLDSLAPTSRAYTYYSPQNAIQSKFNKFIPNANGYPLVQTIISPENPKKIFAQGGAGRELQLDKAHATKYGYSGTFQNELNRLYGSEIGTYDYYQKTSIQDPNGQSSMQVTNSDGKIVYSALFGRGGDSLSHPIDSMELPPVITYTVNVIDNVTQSVGPYFKSLNTTYQNDIEGNNTVQYSNSFAPYNTGCPNKYLSVKSNYHYEILDDCLEIIDSLSGSLGVNGVVNSSTVLTYSDTVHHPYFKKANYTVNKILTFNPDDVATAVDSFIKAPNNCLHDENYFIRKQVEEKQFPCPQDSISPCDEFKRQMLDELYPGHKYGTYQQNNGAFVPWGPNPNSIFTAPTPCDGCTPSYRYQDSCVHFPNTIWKNGIAYSNIKQLNQDDFIYIFNDTIAEALLPQHPEYCKLAACYLQEDKYSDTISAIKNTDEAASIQMLQIGDIASKDPLYLKHLLPSGSTTTDSLIHFTGKINRIDSFAIMQSYCGGLTPQIITTSMNDIYNGVLNTSNPFPLAIAEPLVYEFYYGLMTQCYISNRENIKTKLMANVDSTCPPCNLVRMTLIPKAVFPNLSAVNGGANTASQLDSLNQVFLNDTSLNNLDGLGLPGWMQSSLSSGTMNAATLDSINANANANNSLMCGGMVDNIMSKFKNCTLNPTTLTQIHDSLVAIFCTNQEPWTVARMNLLLTHLGITQTDICNPYVFQLNAMPDLDLSSENLTCKSTDFYTGAKLFFEDVKTTFSSTGSSSTVITNHTLTLSNQFDLGIFNELGLSTSNLIVTVTNTYYPTEHQYKMEVYQNTADKITFWINATSNAIQPYYNYSTFTFTEVQCLMDFSSTVIPSHINLFTFALKSTGQVGSNTVNATYLAYNNRIKTLDVHYGSNKLTSDATTCIEVSRWYKDAKTTLDNLGIHFGHQNYEKALLTIINLNTGKLYTYDDILDFAKSCALTDSTKQLVTTSNWQITCADSVSADNVLMSIANALGYVPDYVRYRLASNKEILLMSYYNMTDDSSYLFLNNHINSLSSSWVTNKIYDRNYGTDTLALVFAPHNSTLTTTLIPSAFANTTDANVVNISSTLDTTRSLYAGLFSVLKYDLFAITLNNSSSIPAYKIARYVDSLQHFVYNTTSGCYVLPNYAGLMNEDYYLNEKQQWLHHNFNTDALRHDSLLQRLTIDSLYANMSSMSGRFMDYGHPVENEKADALYFNNPAIYNTYSGYNMLTAMFACVENKIGTLTASGYPSNYGIVIDFDSLVVPILSGYASTLNGGTNSLKLYRCGSFKPNTFFIRYFDNANKLYTAYYEIPETLPNRKKFQQDVSHPIMIGPGDDQTYRFSFDAFRSTATTLKYKITGYTDFDLGNTTLFQNSLLKPSTFHEYAQWDTTSCERDLINTSIAEGKFLYQQYIDSVRTRMISDFSAYMINAVTEKLNIGVKDLKYYFTLYYYDRAGNLTRTVPPAGVSHFDMTNNTVMNAINNDRNTPLSSFTIIPANLNQHKKVSTYKYNSFNELFEQTTPDGGTSHFWYDAVGRIAYSQNAKQAPDKLYSYTLYDEQGRIQEVGQFKPAPADVTEITDSYQKTLAQIRAFILGKNRTEVCATLYDEEGIDLQNQTGMSKQENLRKRVSASKYFPNVNSNVSSDTAMNYNDAAYYSYDVLGNVKTLTHDFKELLDGKQQFKRIDYDYDLYSGKVDMVSYNRGFADQFYQKYAYDNDNRLLKAESSKDGIYWDREANYEYYAHGPLARMSMGDLNVQGVDYAYTIQGWLKAINGDVLDTLVDMGKDGIGTSAYLKDIFALTLDYFGKDYQSISSIPVSVLSQPTEGLYNGNITRQNVAIQPFSTLNKNYRYDPLNRIKSTAYNNITPSGTTYSTVPTAEFREAFSYDLDGNITKLMRRGNKVGTVIKTMDSLEYFYNANGTNTYANAKDAVNNNKLNNVFDYSNHGLYTNDIPYHPTTAVTSTTPIPERYQYDQIGNLIKDEMNGINSIGWNLYGKVADISLPNNASDHFTYDASGNRISKGYSTYNKTKDTLTELREIYVRDAGGNILAIYNDERASVVSTLTPYPWEPYVDAGFNGIPNFQAILGNVYASNASFGLSIATQASQNSSCFMSVVNPTSVSSYFQANPQLFNKTLANTYNSINYFRNSNPSAVSGAMLALPSSILVDNICTPLGNNTHLEKALLVMNRTHSTATRMFMEQLDLSYTGDSVQDVQAMVDVYQSAPDEFSTTLAQLIDNRDDGELADFKEVFVDGLLTDRQFYTGDSSYYFAPTHQMWCDALYRYSSEDREVYDALIGTVEDNSDVFKPVLINVSDPLELMSVNYQIDPMDVYNKVCGTYGGSNAAKPALKVIPGLTLDKFIGDMEEVQSYWNTLITTTSLFKRHFNLAEHHLYGSSRLGIKKYLSNHYYYNWASGNSTTSIDSSSIGVQQAWFNNSINDFVKYNNTEYVGSSNLDKTGWLSNRIVGLKNYEMTNHLGNVQATVLDKFTPRTQNLTDTAYNIWNANLSTATDFYAFGSPMPGRMAQDTVTQSFVATTPFSNTSPIVIDSMEANTSHFIWTAYGPTSNLTFVTTPTTQIKNDLGCPSSPVTFINSYGFDVTVNNLHPNKNYKFYIKYKASFAETFKFEQIKPNSPFLPIIYQTATSTSSKAVMSLSFTTGTATGPYYFHFVYQNQCNYITIDSVSLVTDTTTTSYVTNVLSDKSDADDYRFSINGQMKGNEIAGLGNHTTAQFWEYDTRLGRRWNLDPKPTVGISDYATFSNNPIFKSDILGDSAWSIKNKWDGNMMNKFQKDLPGIISKLEKSRNKFTCDDLALTSVMTFAKDNNLPFKWETGSGTFDATSDKYKDFGTFKQDVLSMSGAPDFQRDNNAFPVNKHNMFVGGIMLNDHRSNGTAHHVQVVVGLTKAYDVQAKAWRNTSFNIKQGNFNSLGRYLGSDDPKSSRYLGVSIQTGKYDVQQDTFTNTTRGDGEQRHFSEGENQLEFRLFNFSNWNK